MCHLFVADGLGGDLLQCVNPAVPYSIAELLLLSPCHAVGQHGGEGLAYEAFLHGGAWTHLQLGVDAHCHVHKLLVEEGHTAFYAPCHETLVGSEAVVHIQFAEFAYRLFVKGFAVRSFMEIEVASEYLVGTLA